MAALGPFERGPRLAVAVSGGADSLALALLADGWARERGGGIGRTFGQIGEIDPVGSHSPLIHTTRLVLTQIEPPARR